MWRLNLSQTCAGLVGAATVSVSSYVYQFIRVSVLVCQESAASLVCPCPTASHSLSASSSSSLCPERRGLVKMSIRTEYPKVSHTQLVIQLWVASICHRRKLLWWWLTETLIYGYCRMLLGFILLLCSLARTIASVNRTSLRLDFFLNTEFSNLEEFKADKKEAWNQ